MDISCSNGIRYAEAVVELLVSIVGRWDQSGTAAGQCDAQEVLCKVLLSHRVLRLAPISTFGSELETNFNSIES